MKRIADDSIIIVPKRGVNPVTDDTIRKLHESLGTRPKATFPRLRNIQVVELPKGRTNIPETIWEFLQTGLVDIAEPNVIFEQRAWPNDPLLGYDANRKLDNAFNYKDPSRPHNSDTYTWHLFQRCFTDDHHLGHGHPSADRLTHRRFYRRCRY